MTKYCSFIDFTLVSDPEKEQQERNKTPYKMLAGFFSYQNNSVLPPQSVNENTSIPCSMSRPNSLILTTLYISRMLLMLPLSIIILYHRLQEWRKNLSTFSAAKMSHMDTFTYHLVMIELIGVLGNALLCCGIYMENISIMSYVTVFMEFLWYGEVFFHVLTCVERYLAVVHPFIYLSLKNERGARIRNISSLCVWLLCITKAGLTIKIRDDVEIIINVCLLMWCLSVICFCSLSVLRVLIRPVPGEQGEGRQRVDQSKMRMFLTILLILVLLSLRLTGDLTPMILVLVGNENDCVLLFCMFWLQLPNSLALPLMFLLRTGTIVCCQNNKG